MGDSPVVRLWAIQPTPSWDVQLFWSNGDRNFLKKKCSTWIWYNLCLWLPWFSLKFDRGRTCRYANANAILIALSKCQRRWHNLLN